MKRSGQSPTLMRIGIVSAFVTALCIGSLFYSFQSRIQSGLDRNAVPRTAIVFTGQFDRIRFALGLMDEGGIDRLFISGVNPGAGIVPARFAAQFALSPRLASALAAGDIVLATEANTTLENAIETACWLRRHPEIRQVALITSQRHMARASLALERALPAGRHIARLPSDQFAGSGLSAGQLSEFVKFSATWLITLMPKAAWPVNSLNSCAKPEWVRNGDSPT
jgi:uncharacterized SAM-binding protein YcdF (DUF218 family)